MRLAGTVALLVPGCSFLLGFDDPVPDGPGPDAPADAPLCGDRQVQVEEQCDDGHNLEGGNCPHCRFAVCGDGYVRETIEECDPAIAGSQCSADCLACDAGNAQLVRGANQHCYLRFDTPVTYDEAAAACRGRRAHLLTIGDALENTEVQGSLGAFPGSLWMGMTDRTVEGAFTWETDQPFSYTNWQAGTPDNGAGAGENCGGMVAGGTWNDIACNLQLGYLCEQHPWRVLAATGHAYLFVPGRYTWDDARQQCQALGGDLAAITDGEEAAFLGPFVEGRVWIGGNDVAAEGTFVWASREPWAFTQWRQGEPNDTLMLENCVALLGDLGAGWIDQACTTPHPALCEVGP